MGAAKHVSRSGGNTVSRDVGRSPGGQWAPSPGRQTPARHRRPCERGAEGGEGRARPRPSRGCRGAAPTAPFLLGRTAVPAPCPTPGPRRPSPGPRCSRCPSRVPRGAPAGEGVRRLCKSGQRSRRLSDRPAPARSGGASRRRVTPALGGPGAAGAPAGLTEGPAASLLSQQPKPQAPVRRFSGRLLVSWLAGRSRLTHTEQVCCQRAFQVSTWRPFPRRGRGRPATPPSVSPQTRGRGAGPPARHEPLGTARRLAASHRPGRARHGSEARCTVLLHDVKPFHVC